MLTRSRTSLKSNNPVQALTRSLTSSLTLEPPKLSRAHTRDLSSSTSSIDSFASVTPSMAEERPTSTSLSNSENRHHSRRATIGATLSRPTPAPFLNVPSLTRSITSHSTSSSIPTAMFQSQTSSFFTPAPSSILSEPSWRAVQPWRAQRHTRSLSTSSSTLPFANLSRNNRSSAPNGLAFTSPQQLPLTSPSQSSLLSQSHSSIASNTESSSLFSDLSTQSSSSSIPPHMMNGQILQNPNLLNGSSVLLDSQAGSATSAESERSFGSFGPSSSLSSSVASRHH
jgi:hypothetical protein